MRMLEQSRIPCGFDPYKTTATLLLLALTSCRMPMPEVDRDAQIAVPERYAAAPPAGTNAPADWWTTFENPELNELIAQAIDGSPTLDQFAARLRQAQETARQAGARRIPELSLTAEAASNRRLTFTGPERIIVSTENYSLGLAAGYELDLWGRIGATARSALRAARASRADLETAAMTLIGQVTDRWLRLVEAQGQVRLLEQQLATHGKTLDLLMQRTLKAGQPLLDVYQQQQILRATEAQLPAAHLEVELLRNELAVLTGRAPGSQAPATARALPELPPFPETGLPADVLLQRPDVRAQWLRLEAAAWDVAAARADRLPAVRLTGNAAYNSDTLSRLFDDWIANLAASLTGPLLDGGRRRAEVRRTQAVMDERLASYRQTVLDALREVDDALRSERQLAAQLTARRRQLDSAKKTLDESQRRYLKGAINYLPVLTALRSLEELQRSEWTAHRQLLVNRVALHRALGGAWTDAAADTALANDSEKEPPP